jgi:hypothetical protein
MDNPIGMSCQTVMSLTVTNVIPGNKKIIHAEQELSDITHLITIGL